MSKKNKLLDVFYNISFTSLLLVIALLPFFFLPFTNIQVETSKGLLLAVGLTFSVIFWSLARFLDGKIILPRSTSLLGGAGVVLVFFLSALFSKAPHMSFFGTMFDIGSFWFIFAGFLLMLMCSIVFRNPKSAKIVLFGAMISVAVVLIFQCARLFIPDVLSLGVLPGKTGNVLGSWNSLGLFAGLGALMSLLVVEFFSTTRTEKFILGALTVLSVLFVAVVNFSFVWVLLGISSLIIFVYKVSMNSNKNGDEGEKTYFPVFSFAVIIISLFFFMSGQFIGGILPNRLGLPNTEISPFFPYTMLVTKSVLKENPMLGIGPNRFGIAWAMYKPIAVNNTAFWDVPLDSDLGFIPIFVSTVGYLGILAWLVFFALFIISGVKSIALSVKNSMNWETTAFFVMSLYLFISSFFYSTGTVLFLLALAFAGVFIGLSASGGSSGTISISYINDHRKSFFSILLLVILVVISAAGLFKYIERFASVPYFGKAVTATTVPVAEAAISKAMTLYINDLYLRTYSEIYLAKINSIIGKGTALTDADKTNMQASLAEAVNGSKLATTYDSSNYLNFRELGSTYQVAGALGIKDGYSSAVSEYTIASALNPLNPRIKLEMASASFADGKVKEAKDFAKSALSLKPDYIDALIVLSQIAKSEGDNAGAISYAEAALALLPTDKNLIQYVDALKNPNSSNVVAPADITAPPSDTTPKIKTNSGKKP